MNKDNFKKWIDALRSGHYKQGSGALHDLNYDTYCCVGVACVVANVPSKIEPILHKTSQTSVAPIELYEWLGVKDDSITAQAGEFFGSCYEWNDGQHLGFDKIADLIEEWVEDNE